MMIVETALTIAGLGASIFGVLRGDWFPAALIWNVATFVLWLMVPG